MSTAQDLPLPYAEPLAAAPSLRLVPTQPLDFDEAVRRVRPRLHRYAIRRLGDTHEAEELVQEALLRAYTHREQLLTEEDLSAWSTVVTGRLVIDRLRVRGRSTSVADVPEGTRVGRDTADVVVARDEARTALDALDAMPSRQAALLWAREVEGKSYDELCSQFGMTEPAVRSVLTRARKALRKEYELRGGTLPVGGLAVLAPWITGLGWAEKLRRAANRLTAPAALGATGIAALGGLILIPFGAGPAPSTSTYSPTQAVVQTTALSQAEPAAAHGLAATVSAVRPVGLPAVAEAPRPRPKLAFSQLDKLPCTEHADEGALPDATPAGTPVGVGFGGSSCVAQRSDVTVNHSLPADSVTGFDHLTISSTDLTCDQLSPVTRRTTLITCNKETQP